MAPHRPKSPKERRDDRNARSFIGRIEQQDQFQRSLLQPNHIDAKIIFSISGQGGVGKTTLLKEFRRIAEENGHVATYVNEGVATNRVDDAPEAMHRLVEDLEQQGFKFDSFRKRYRDYRVKKQELEAKPEAPKGMVGDVVRGATKLAIDAGKSSIPVVGGMLDSELIATKVGEVATVGWERFRDKDDERLMKETLEELTPLFLEGINRIPPEKTLILMLDTYEETGTFLDQWVRALLDEEFGKIEVGLLLCAAGRQPLDRNAWAEWEPVIARSPLEAFTEAETRQFLANKGIQSEAVVAEIWRLSSGGLPLLVSLMAESAPKSPDAVVDHCDLAVERFLKWETDDAKKQLAQDGALPRVLNADVMAVLGDGQFDWLKRRAFVVRDGARWRYHLVVREQMLRYQLQKSLKWWAEVHGKLAAYYNEVRQGLELEIGKEAEDERWRELSLEWLYHELCAAPQAKLGMALNGFLTALKASPVFAWEWAEVMMQAGQETVCESLQRWGERLRDSMVANWKEHYEEAIPALTALMAETVIQEKLKAVALDWRGCWYSWSKQEELALKDLQQAVKIDEEDSEYWVDLAQTYQNLERYNDAIAAYGRAIELDPNSAYLHNNLGSVYKQQQRYDQTIAAYRRAIELGPNWATPHYGLGDVYKEQKQYDEAIAAYQRAVELGPKAAYPHYGLGDVYKEQKQYDEAIAAYQRAVELDPKAAYPHYGLGDVYKEQKQYEAAIAAYQQAIKLDPNWATPHNNLGFAYWKQARSDEAIAAYQQAIKLDPIWANPHILLGILYEEQKQYEAAISAYQQAIKLDPKWAYPHISLGIVYEEQKQYEAAISAYQQAIKLDPIWAEPHDRLGTVYREQKQYEAAILAYQHAIKLDPKWAYPHDHLGTVYEEQKHYEAAIAAHQQAIKLDPEHKWAFANRGATYLLMKRYDDALKDFDRAIELGLEFGQMFYVCALVHLKLNHPDLAQNNFQQAISLAQTEYEKEPTDWRNIYGLALCHLSAGNQQESDRLYQSGLNAPSEWLEMTIQNLDDLLNLFPDHQPFQQMKTLLQASLG